MPATNSDDVLSTTKDGQILSGLAGNDTLTSEHNNTTLSGDAGDDVLITELLSSQSGEFSATQLGGTGNDRLNALVHLFGEAASADIMLNGGDGDDFIVSNLLGQGNNTFSVKASGASGNDIINLDTRLGLVEGAGQNFADGGDGDDHITARAETNFVGFNSLALNTIHGGAGNDFIEVTAIGWSNGDDLASNVILAGDGDDFVRAFTFSDSNVGAPQGRNSMEGGKGNDHLEAYQYTDGENAITDLMSILDGGVGDDYFLADSLALTELGGVASVVHRLTGDRGNDTFISTIKTDGAALIDIHSQADGGQGDDAIQAHIEGSIYELTWTSAVHNVLEGGNGKDTLTAAITVVVREDFQFIDPSNSLDFSNHLTGGIGHDNLEAHLEVTVEDYEAEGQKFYDVGRNELFGGSGNDNVIASVDGRTASGATTANGANFLHGEDGNDHLTVIGGMDNVLDGGDGNDTLTGGIGRDRVIGGRGNDDLRGGGDSDTFSFGLHSGQNIIRDFEVGFDSIDLLDGLTIASTKSKGEDTTIRFSDGSSVLLMSVTVDSIMDLFSSTLSGGEGLF